MAAIDVIDALAPQARDKGVGFDPVLPPRGAAGSAKAGGGVGGSHQVIQWSLHPNGWKALAGARPPAAAAATPARALTTL